VIQETTPTKIVNPLMNNSESEKEGGSTDDNATESTPAPTPAAVSTPNLVCSFCDKHLPSDKYKKCNCKTTIYCRNASCQKEHWKAHKKEHQKLCKALNAVKNVGEEDDDSKSGSKNKTSSPTIQPKPIQEEKDECPICLDDIPLDCSQFTRYVCCGKGLHHHCSKQLKQTKSKNIREYCPLCRSKSPTEEEANKHLQKWVKKKKAWAQYTLGNMYEHGLYGVKKDVKRAFVLYTLAAEQGDANAQYELGIMYDKGEGTKPDVKRALELITLAAEKGLAKAQQSLGNRYLHGTDGVKKDVKRAFVLYTLAAEQGLAHAQYNLGLMYATGDGIEQSDKKARELWTKAAAQGDENAIEGLKWLDEREGLKTTTPPPPEVIDPNIISCSTCGKQQTEEFKLKKCTCRTKYYCNEQCQKKEYKKHKKECLRLVKERKKNGQNKKNGSKDGKKKTPEPKHEAEDKEYCPICTDALPKLSIAFTRLTCCGKGLHDKCAKDLRANKSMTREQKNTCIMCRAKCIAKGSKEDIERLRGWVKKGKAWAMASLAQRYTDGVGVKQSDKKTIELLEMAATRGNASAQYNLGVYYHHSSHGLTQSSKKAIEYYTLSADQGDEAAQYNLGVMYATGDGIETSYSKAREWLTKSAAQGNEDAIFNLKQLEQLGL
jgi:TPR repeat protein